MNYPNLTAEMSRLGIKKLDIARLLNKSAPTVYAKFGSRTFTTDEMIAIRDKFFPNATLDYLYSKAPSEVTQ